MGDSLPALDLGTGRRARAVILGTAASAGDEHACALLDDWSAKCWGEGGSLGLGDTRPRGSGPGEMGDALPAVKLFSDVW
jgi:E3 ubiquitin-protein ligase HERC3